MKITLVFLALLVALAPWSTATMAQTPPGLLTGPKWNLIEVNGVTVRDSPAHVRFDPQTKRYHGSSSCNFIMGRYQADETNLTFSQAVITRRNCQNPEVDKVEQEFLKVFYKTTRFWIQDDVLRLYNGDQRTLVFRASTGKPD
jgi:heat shock protein HslJ